MYNFRCIDSGFPFNYHKLLAVLHSFKIKETNGDPRCWWFNFNGTQLNQTNKGGMMKPLSTVPVVPAFLAMGSDSFFALEKAGEEKEKGKRFDSRICLFKLCNI